MVNAVKTRLQKYQWHEQSSIHCNFYLKTNYQKLLFIVFCLKVYYSTQVLEEFFYSSEVIPITLHEGNTTGREICHSSGWGVTHSVIIPQKKNPPTFQSMEKSKINHHQILAWTSVEIFVVRLTSTVD